MASPDRNSAARRISLVEPNTRSALSMLMGRSAAMVGVRERILSIAEAPIPVLILGETGTGKDVCAAAIAAVGRSAPYVPVNCATLAEALADSQLFGHERGAFTGAFQPHRGFVEQAAGGTLFLDEIQELPRHLQAKLLRTLDSGEYRRLGAERTRTASFRVLVASNADIDALVAKGSIRLDFIQRVGVVRIHLVPLRERIDDIPILTEHFLESYRRRDPRAPATITSAAMNLMSTYRWPGNVRQLKNVVEAGAGFAAGCPRLDVRHILEFVTDPSRDAPPEEKVLLLSEVRRQAELSAIRNALAVAGGDHREAMRYLGISSATFYRKLDTAGMNGHSN